MSTDRTGSVLLVEDTRSLSALYGALLEKAGHEVVRAYTAAEAATLFEPGRFDVVLLDLILPDGNGLDLLGRLRESAPETCVVVITSDGSIKRAVEAMRSGAFDFLVKPFDERRLLGAVENALAAGRIEEKPGSAEPRAAVRGFRGFIGSSDKIRQIYRMVDNIGRSTATVFITGESGTGKEVCAHAIHDVSVRREKPFIAINCGAIPRDLLESEVFGHLKGSFTGAISDKRGAAAAADGGTLFLDEICEMDLALQTKLLRFLQSSMIQPVGAAEPRKVDVRIICASNRDPAAEVRAGRFREDLFYRLHVVPIHLPPLRARGGDALEIAEVLLRQFAREEGRRFVRLNQETCRIFREYDWPGNVRELQNVLRNVVVLHDGEEVTADMLPVDFGYGAEADVVSATHGAAVAMAPLDVVADVNGLDRGGVAGDGDPVDALVGSSLADLERRFIESTIRQCDGSIPKAARMLEVSPSTIYRKREAWHRDEG